MNTKNNLNKVIITGGAGFIGSNLVKKLLENGTEKILIIDDLSTGKLKNLEDFSNNKSIEIIKKRVEDIDNLNTMFEKFDFCFHLAAGVGVQYIMDNVSKALLTNIEGTHIVIEACKENNVPLLITSTSEVYGTAQFTPISEDHPLVAQSPYAASKIGADMMVTAYARSFDLPAVILRPFNTYGPRQSERAVLPTIIRQAIDPECEAIYVGNLTPIRDFNYVEDIAEAFAAAGITDRLEFGIPYNAGSGIGVTIGETASLICKICGTNKPIKNDENRHRPENSEVFELLANAENFQKTTGWMSNVNLRDGLTKTIEWWRQQYDSTNLRRDRGMMY